MKRMKNFAVLALFLMTVLVLSGCVGSKGTVSGTIIDSFTEEAIQDALVTIGSESVKTSADGSYSIQIKTGSHNVKVEKAGYTTYTGSVTVEKDTETTLDVQLVGIPGTVSGTVTNSLTQQPVADAEVTIGTNSTTTDANGVYSINLVPGTYDVSVTKTNFAPYSGTVTVLKEQAVTLDIPLVDISKTGTIKGIVTDGRGGPVVEGVTVRVANVDHYATTTDANGQFELTISADHEVELLVEAEDRATMRVQAIEVAEDEELFLEIPTRDIFNPNWSATPPTISLNIQPGQELTGNQEIEVTVQGELDTYLIYAYLGANHRNPRTLFESETNESTVTVDTTNFPNGETFLKVLVYDENENGALYVLPITINNTADDEVLPDTLTHMNVIATTYGQNIGFYGIKDPKIAKAMENSVTAAPAGASLNINVSWEPVDNADGYAIYRAFAESTGEEVVYGEYTLFSRVPATETSIDDFSAQIAANRAMKYKVVPYNSFGEGLGIERKVTPLPALNVYLESPADKSYDVALNPTFTWRSELTGGDQDLQFYHELTIYDATDYIIWSDSIIDQDTYDLTALTLDPNGIYSWDISSSEAFVIYDDEPNGLSAAITTAGEYGGTGSVNGEYIFTTTINVQ